MGDTLTRSYHLQAETDFEWHTMIAGADVDVVVVMGVAAVAADAAADGVAEIEFAGPGEYPVDLCVVWMMAMS